MINLIKLCVGINSIEHLIEVRKKRREQGLARYENYDVHRTRMMPKKRDEIINKGSIYWVINGQIQCRQLIVDLQKQIDEEGKSCCDIVMDKKIIRTIWQPKQAFQGWRYLKPSDAPADLDARADKENMEIVAQLSKLGLI